MTGQKHCCANCYFFQDSGLSGQGHCTHPRRIEPGNGPGRLVRRQELACRNGWGEDLFTDPATVKERGPDDRLVAQSASSPAQVSLPEPVSEPEDRLIARDRTPNMAAQNDQDDRAKVMQRGPGDALRRAHRIYRDRNTGATRSTTSEPLATTEPVNDTPEPTDIAVHTTRPAPRRSIVPAVPRAEAQHRYHDDSSIWDEVPTIAADVELPLLRESFRLPGQPPASEPTTASPTQPSRYDLALQKAQEYRLAKTREDADTDDRVTSTAPVREHVEERHAPTPAEADPIDEIVRYEPQRGTELDRFRVTPEPIETDEAYLDEDYELDRTWRNEAPSRQSGHRWWKAFGRSRVFGHDRTEDDRVVAAPQMSIHETPIGNEPGIQEPVTTPSLTARPAPPNMTITWDDRTLAPQPTLAHEFASLDYLDDDPVSDMDTPRRSFAELRAVESPFATSAPSRFNAEPAGERIAGTDRTLHRWTYRDAQPEPARTHPEPASDDLSPIAPPAGIRAETQAPDVPNIDLDTMQAPAFDIRRVIARNVDPLLDMTIEIAPDTPRECGTCRHFRASGNGERGWCTNTWAFPHRPLVNANTVHCTSTIGCWWLPADEDWDPEEYFEWLDQSTPRADRIIAALYGEEPDRQYGN